MLVAVEEQGLELVQAQVQFQIHGAPDSTPELEGPHSTAPIPYGRRWRGVCGVNTRLNRVRPAPSASLFPLLLLGVPWAAAATQRAPRSLGFAL